jgi:hypothetical protein
MRSRREVIFIAALACALALPGTASRGQERGLSPQEFGVEDEQVYNLNPSDFQVALGGYSAGTLFEFDTGWSVASGSESVTLFAPVHLPQGSRLSTVTAFYSDTHPTSNPQVQLARTRPSGGGAILEVSFPDFSGGENNVTETLPENPIYVVDNQQFHYSIRAVLRRSTGDTSQTQTLRRIQLRYLRQVSPAPSTASLTDVATSHPFFQFIEALFLSGITAGCQAGPRMF